MRKPRRWRLVGAWGLVFVVFAGLAASVASVIIPRPPAPINVRWAASVAEAERTGLERRFQLRDGVRTEGTTWTYMLADPSSAIIRAIVQDPRVEDTAHVDRERFQPDADRDRSARVRLAAVLGGAGATLLCLTGPLVIGRLRRPLRLSSSALVAALTAAPLLYVAAVVSILGMAADGVQPLWSPSPDGTLVDAALEADRAAVERLIAAGWNPNAPEASGKAGEGHASAAVTPLEAAVLSGDLGTVQLLRRAGAAMDESMRVRLVCLAEAVHAGAIVDYLRGDDAPPTAARCAAIDLPRH